MRRFLVPPSLMREGETVIHALTSLLSALASVTFLHGRPTSDRVNTFLFHAKTYILIGCVLGYEGSVRPPKNPASQPACSAQIQMTGHLVPYFVITG